MADALTVTDDDTANAKPTKAGVLADMWQIPLDQGWQVIMLEARSEQPRPRDWQGYYTRNNVHDDIANWSASLLEFGDLNAGIVTDVLSGLVVLALDSDTAINEAARCGLPDRTVAARTPSGGLHLYFQQPATAIVGKVQLFDGAALIGQGEFVPAPGTTVSMPNGRAGQYRWEESCSPIDTPLAALPDWAFSAIAASPSEAVFIGVPQAVNPVVQQDVATPPVSPAENFDNTIADMASEDLTAQHGKRWEAVSNAMAKAHAAINTANPLTTDALKSIAEDAGRAAGIQLIGGTHHADLKSMLVNVAVATGMTKGDAGVWVDVGWKAGFKRTNGQYQPLDISPITGQRFEPPAFQVEVMGAQWADWITKRAAAAGAPIAYVACTALTVCAALIGNARNVQAWPGWDEPCILWMALVGEPSAGKSPALRPVLKLIEAIDRDFVARFGITSAEYEAKVAMAKAAKEDWEARAKAAHKKGEAAPPFPRDAVVPDLPVCQAFRVDDATIEKLAAIANVSPKGMLMAKDELAGLLANLSRYSGGSDRPHWLQAYNGDERRIDRQKSATPLMIPHWSISLLGGIQPDRFRDLMARDSDNDGLSARFLKCYPDPVPPKRPARPLPWAVDPAEIAVRRLFGLALVLVEGHEAPLPHIVPLSDDAADRFQAWRETHDAERVDGLAKGDWGKMPGQVLRIAHTLELMQWAMTDPIEREPDCVTLASLNGALVLIEEFFKPMALRVYGEIATPSDLSATAALAKWIAATKPTSFNARTIRDQAGLPSMLRGKADKGGALMKVACDGLIEFGWLKFLGGRTDGRAGRQGQNYEVNPMLWSALAETGKT